MIKIKPCGHRVLVELEAVKYKGPLVLIDDEDERQTKGKERGTIRALGPNAFDAFGGKESWADVGDQVYFMRYEGFYFEEDGVSYRVINDDDVIAKEIADE